MGKSTSGSFTMRTSVISFGILLLVPSILADSFAGERVKVGKKTCTCDFTFVLNGDRVNVKSSLVSCDKKCSGAAKNLDQELEAQDLVPLHFLPLVAMEQAQTASVVWPRGTPRLSEARRLKSASGHGRPAWSGAAAPLSSVEQQSLAM